MLFRSDPKIVKFLATGVLNTIFGYSVYGILLLVSVPYLVALFISTVAGVIFNYISFGRIVFNGHGGWFIFSKFVIAYLLIYVINAVLLRFLIANFLLNPYLGQAICIPISVMLSWLLMNYWVYKNE